MWSWIACYLSGSHAYRIRCDAGAMFLFCPSCGRRSRGWTVSRPSPLTEGDLPQTPARRSLDWALVSAPSVQPTSVLPHAVVRPATRSLSSPSPASRRESAAHEFHALA